MLPAKYIAKCAAYKPALTWQEKKNKKQKTHLEPGLEKHDAALQPAGSAARSVHKLVHAGAAGTARHGAALQYSLLTHCTFPSTSRAGTSSQTGCAGKGASGDGCGAPQRVSDRGAVKFAWKQNENCSNKAEEHENQAEKKKHAFPLPIASAQTPGSAFREPGHLEPPGRGLWAHAPRARQKPSSPCLLARCKPPAAQLSSCKHLIRLMHSAQAENSIYHSYSNKFPLR